jgi:nucleotide-binding universal stress UspA family protein
MLSAYGVAYRGRQSRRIARECSGRGEVTMFARLLVPLDGSELAEKALAYAEYIGREVGSELHLLRVVPRPATMQADAELVILADSEATLAEESAAAEQYLTALASRLAATGLCVSWNIEVGDAASEIVENARKSGADLIVMSTHGRSGVGRWVYGSVADRVLRVSAQPVLLVRASSPLPGQSASGGIVESG